MKLLHPFFLASALSLHGLASELPAETPLQTAPAATPALATEVINFWREAGPARWFAKDAEFDRLFRTRFIRLHEAAVRGELDTWQDSMDGALALVILLDQFPRNAFRGSPRMYASDAQAVAVADRAIARGFDMALDPAMRLFLYLPFGHSENLQLQERSVSLSLTLGAVEQQHARGHRDIVRRFGRFPHRNPILGRPMRPDEQKFLDEGGFAG